MTKEEFAALLRLLGGSPVEAWDRYEEIRRKLTRLFEWRGCDIPEELVDETFDRVARRVAEDEELIKNKDPYGYFCGVANLVHKEYLRTNARQQAKLEQADWPPVAIPEEDEEDHRLESLRHCLQLLPEDQRLLLLRYHQGENNIRVRKELCDELGIPMNALRIRVHRLRRRLETCIEERQRG
jgi:DNA-directed RNA polymerase specialized sigma24 family protein